MGRKPNLKENPEPNPTPPPDLSAVSRLTDGEAQSLIDGVLGAERADGGAPTGDTPPRGRGRPSRPEARARAAAEAAAEAAAARAERAAYAATFTPAIRSTWKCVGSAFPPEGFTPDELDALAASWAEAVAWWAPRMGPEWWALAFAGLTSLTAIIAARARWKAAQSAQSPGGRASERKDDATSK